MSAQILVVDNHDSFVHTLCGYVRELDAACDLVESDALPGVDLAAALQAYDGVLVSPGPGAPVDAGASIAVVHAAAALGLPLLGVCLGHQAIGEAFGARVAHAPEPMHGMTSAVHHDGSMLFEGLPSPFRATRYHSLAIVPETLPADLTAVAWTDAGVVMGVAHASLPIWGVQFHPESVLTEGGYRLVGNWLERTGVADAAARGALLHPHRTV